MAENDDERWLLRREWEAWRKDVYEYRHSELLHSISMMMSTIDHLDTVVERMSNVTAVAESVAKDAEKLRNNWWLRAGIVIALFAPMAAVILEKVWR